MKRAGRVCLLAAGLVAAAGWSWAATSVDEKRPLNADALVEVSNVSGSVKIEAGTARELHVTGTLGESVERLDISGGPDRMVVRVILPRTNGGRGSADLTLRMPAGCRLVTDTVSADTTVTGLKGTVETKTVSGEIVIKGEPSSVEATTVSGEVSVTASGATMRIKSVSGDVGLSGVAGDVTVHTVSGDVTLGGGALSQLKVETTSGDVTADASLAKSARSRIQTMSGDVDLTLPSGSSVAVEVNTMSGDIDNALGSSARPKSHGFGPGRSLDMTLGSGDASLDVKTMSGDVRLKAR